MRRRILFGALLAIIFGWINSTALATEIKYNRNEAAKYAARHCSTPTYNHDQYKCWDPKNPKCVNYKKGGGTDCANFMSQSLISGGITFPDCLKGKGLRTHQWG